MRYLVTGANRGIGLEFTRQLTSRGEHVLATARHPEEAGELQELAAERSAQIDLITLDITNPDSVSGLAEHLEDDTLDVLINNAGSYAKSGRLGELDYAAMERDFRTNALGTLRVVEACLPALMRSEERKIVNVTSKMGSIADNGSGGSYAYRMSKAALNMATRSLAHDLDEEGFVCIVVHPGWVETRMGGPNALITPETSVSSILSLVDDATVAESGRFWEWNGNEIPW